LYQYCQEARFFRTPVLSLRSEKAVECLQWECKENMSRWVYKFSTLFECCVFDFEISFIIYAPLFPVLYQYCQEARFF
jgi:hypothetical protein